MCDTDKEGRVLQEASNEGDAPEIARFLSRARPFESTKFLLSGVEAITANNPVVDADESDSQSEEMLKAIRKGDGLDLAKYLMKKQGVRPKQCMFDGLKTRPRLSFKGVTVTKLSEKAQTPTHNADTKATPNKQGENNNSYSALRRSSNTDVADSQKTPLISSKQNRSQGRFLLSELMYNDRTMQFMPKIASTPKSAPQLQPSIRASTSASKSVPDKDPEKRRSLSFHERENQAVTPKKRTSAALSEDAEEKASDEASATKIAKIQTSEAEVSAQPLAAAFKKNVESVNEDQRKSATAHSDSLLPLDLALSADAERNLIAKSAQNPRRKRASSECLWDLRSTIKRPSAGPQSKKKLPLNKEPGEAINGEGFAADFKTRLTFMTNRQILDLRMNVSSKETRRKSLIPKNLTKEQKMQMYDKIENELKRRNFEQLPRQSEEQPKESAPQLEEQRSDDSAPTAPAMADSIADMVIVPPPVDFSDSGTASPANNDDLADEKEYDRVSFIPLDPSLRNRTQNPGGRRTRSKQKLSAEYLGYLQAKLSLSTRPITKSKRSLYNKGYSLTEDDDAPTEPDGRHHQSLIEKDGAASPPHRKETEDNRKSRSEAASDPQPLPPPATCSTAEDRHRYPDDIETQLAFLHYSPPPSPPPPPRNSPPAPFSSSEHHTPDKGNCASAGDLDSSKKKHSQSVAENFYSPPPSSDRFYSPNSLSHVSNSQNARGTTPSANDDQLTPLHCSATRDEASASAAQGSLRETPATRKGREVQERTASTSSEAAAQSVFKRPTKSRPRPTSPEDCVGLRRSKRTIREPREFAIIRSIVMKAEAKFAKERAYREKKKRELEQERSKAMTASKIQSQLMSTDAESDDHPSTSTTGRTTKKTRKQAKQAGGPAIPEDEEDVQQSTAGRSKDEQKATNARRLISSETEQDDGQVTLVVEEQDNGPSTSKAAREIISAKKSKPKKSQKKAAEPRQVTLVVEEQDNGPSTSKAAREIISAEKSKPKKSQKKASEPRQVTLVVEDQDNGPSTSKAAREIISAEKSKPKKSQKKAAEPRQVTLVVEEQDNGPSTSRAAREIISADKSKPKKSQKKAAEPRPNQGLPTSRAAKERAAKLLQTERTKKKPAITRKSPLLAPVAEEDCNGVEINVFELDGALSLQRTETASRMRAHDEASNRLFDNLKTTAKRHQATSSTSNDRRPLGLKRLRVRLARVKLRAESSSSQLPAGWLERLVNAERKAPMLEQTDCQSDVSDLVFPSFAELCYWPVSGIDCAFYSTQKQGEIGFVRLQPGQGKSKHKYSDYDFYFTVIVGKVRVSLNEETVEQKGGDMFVAHSNVEWGLVNISDGVTVLFLLRRFVKSSSESESESDDE